MFQINIESRLPTTIKRCGKFIRREEGIRTLDTLLAYTHFPGVRLRPLGHLSKFIIIRFFKRRSEEHTSELQSRPHLVCRLLLEKKNINYLHDSAVFDLRQDHVDSLTSNKHWIPTDGSPARLYVEPCVALMLDSVGYRRFVAPCD